MTADTYTRLDAAYLLGALDTAERLAYEEHLVACTSCQASLADISGIPPLLAGLDESACGPPIDAVTAPVPDTMLPRLLQAAARERARHRWLTTGLGLLTVACAIALIVIVVPATNSPKPASRAMTALVATPISATIALQPRPWGTEIDLTCWYHGGTAEPLSDRYELIVHSADGITGYLGSWRLVPGRKVTFTSGTALTETQIKDLQITRPNGIAILGLAVPRLLRTTYR